MPAAKEPAKAHDIVVVKLGTLFLFRALNSRAEDWVLENVDASNPWDWFGDAIIVEQKYIEPLVEGAIAAGLTVRRAQV